MCEFVARFARLLFTREDGKDQHFGVGQLRPQLCDDRGNAFRDFLRRIGFEVVGANHEHGEFRGNAVDVSVIQAPEHVLGLVAAYAEIDGVTVAVVGVPYHLAFAFPPMSDRVADKQKVGVALLDALIESLMPFHPPLVALSLTRHRLDGRVLLCPRSAYRGARKTQSDVSLPKPTRILHYEHLSVDPPIAGIPV